MIYTKAITALTLASTSRAANAFSPIIRRTALPASQRLISSALKANVAKLSEPGKDLLPDVDVFIFDCDGVIWRVSLFAAARLSEFICSCNYLSVESWFSFL